MRRSSNAIAIVASVAIHAVVLALIHSREERPRPPEKMEWVRFAVRAPAPKVEPPLEPAKPAEPAKKHPTAKKRRAEPPIADQTPEPAAPPAPSAPSAPSTPAAPGPPSPNPPSANPNSPAPNVPPDATSPSGLGGLAVGPLPGVVARAPERGGPQLFAQRPQGKPSANAAVGPPGMRSDGEGGYRYRDSNFSARIQADGTVELSDKPDVDFDGIDATGRASFSWDLNDLIAKANGEDPYQYDKAKFLRDTRELRAAMCDREQKERLKQSIFDLKHDLLAMWKNGALSKKERRARIFDLWDSCAEDGDPEIARAGAMARATILGFIKERLPAGHPDAFTTAELLALNARRKSKTAFEPYD